MSGPCRLCLAPEARSRISRGLATRIHVCCQLRISKSDGLTDWICLHCIIMLEKLANFISICKESDLVLRKNFMDTEANHNANDNIEVDQANLEPICKLECVNSADTEIDEEPPDSLLVKEEIISDHDDNTSDVFNPFNQPDYPDDNDEHNVKTEQPPITIATKINLHHCQLCNKNFISLRGLSVHMHNHNAKNEFGCMKCGVRFGSKSEQKEHENVHCTTYPCDKCGKVFTKQSHMKTHVRDVHLKLQRVQCDVCDKYLNTNSSYRKHMKSHSNQHSYQCDLCGKKFTNRGCIVRHLKKHTKKKLSEGIILCPICGKVLKKKSFYTHMQVHCGEKKYICKICKKSFISNAKRKEHEAIHATDQIFNCSQCDKVFTCQRNCKNHEKYVHQKLRRVQCKICNKFLCSKTSYENHMKTHTGQWDYECDICKKNFIHKSNIISHLRMHFGDRPYACQYCPSKFTDGKTLVEHERLHTGEKPYKCPVCEKGFAQKGNMKSHIRYNHKNVCTK